ncbi:MAG: NifU family protein [Rhizomicrobium sp.]|nr:NifU family protein [Rhizomicrobium sp.]
MLEQVVDMPLPPPPVSERDAVIASVIAEMRPVLQRDGGDIELITIEGDMVVVDMKGSCVGCVLASVTLAGVRKKLMDAVGGLLRVMPLSATTIRRS